jgi:6-phosphogluconate dehydrogenase
MVGGPEESYASIRDIIEAIAARYQDEPCAAWLGPDGAGHFVKTVHNGIEYADMQLIAEVWGILRDGQARSPASAAELFREWNGGPLQSYLVEITAEVLAASDPLNGGPMVNAILDKAGQKGTGRWTVIEALKLGQSASTIEAAVGARSWSAAKDARARGAALFPDGDLFCRPVLDGELEEALIAARVIAYGQGFALMAAASDHFGWEIDLARVAEIWRAGCIIRSGMLDDIATAVREGLPHGQLIFAPDFAARLDECMPSLRRVTCAAMAGGLPVPAMAAAVSFFDTMRRARGTADLIQAQRDFFGAHGFERVDGQDAPHGPWHAA